MKKPLGTAGGSSPADDSDLEDLLATKAGGGGSGSGTDNVEINLDHLTRDGGHPPVRGDPPARGAASSSSYDQRFNRYYGPPAGLCGAIYAHFYMFFYRRPACGMLCTVLGVAALVYAFVYVVDPSGRVGMGEVKHDWTTVKSELDLKAGDIDHWCIGGGDKSCRCEDPLIPADRGEFKSWVTAHAQNKKALGRYKDDWENPDNGGAKIDVAFVGESLIEEMDGRWLGLTKGEHLDDLAKLFKKHFSKQNGAALEGVALGVAGDTAPNVLWRLIHGEMPYDFNPKVWWVSLGMNDLARMRCSEEVVIMGVIRVVEEIRNKKPDAKIVINSLLPMHDFRSGMYPQQTDYRDAFRNDVVQNRWRGRQPPVPASHFARNPNKPNKQIQGEPEERPGETRNPRKDRKDRFPGGGRRLLDGGNNAAGQMRGGGGGRVAPPPEHARNKQPSPEQAAQFAKVREKMEKQLAQRVKRDKVNPILRNRDKYKKLDPKTFFMRKSQIPLWPAITAINVALRRFAEKHEHVTFFDSTSIFAERNGPKSMMLRSDMISPRGHPTDEGFQAWEKAVANKLHYMLNVKPGQKAEKKIGDTAAVPGWKSPNEERVPAMPLPRPEIGGEDRNRSSEGKEEDESSVTEEEGDDDDSETEDDDDSETEDDDDSETEDDDDSETEDEDDETEDEEEEEEEEEEKKEEKKPVKKVVSPKKVKAKDVEQVKRTEKKTPTKPVKKKTATKKTKAKADEEG